MMNAQKVVVWAATCEDKPGGAMRRLEGLAQSGADLKFIFTRRLETEPNKGVIFVAPLEGERQKAAAKVLGFAPTPNMWVVRVEAADEPGLAYMFAGALAGVGINMRGLSGMVVRGVFVAYLAFDSEADAERAAERLRMPL
jgi:hypothetical protein